MSPVLRVALGILGIGALVAGGVAVALAALVAAILLGPRTASTVQPPGMVMDQTEFAMTPTARTTLVSVITSPLAMRVGSALRSSTAACAEKSARTRMTTASIKIQDLIGSSWLAPRYIGAIILPSRGERAVRPRCPPRLRRPSLNPASAAPRSCT